MIGVVTHAIFSAPFLYGFSVFLGVVAGAFVQYGLMALNRRREAYLAKRLLAVEVEINRKELDRLESKLQVLKESIVAGQFGEGDHYLDMGRFVYRIADPLINTGHFHRMRGPDGVQAYFRFANDLNANAARFLSEKALSEHREGRSLQFLRGLIDTRVSEWRAQIDLVGSKVGAP